jgi:hypothetical protein
MPLKQNELIVSIWSDFEPIQKEWPDFNRFDFWKSAMELKYPETSLMMAEKFCAIRDTYGIKLTWGIFSCIGLFEWIPYLSDFLKKVDDYGDAITIHPHWLNWLGHKWERCRAPNEQQILESLKPISILSQYNNYSSSIRSGWNTQKTCDNKFLYRIYRDTYGFSCVGDTYKNVMKFDYKKENGFMILPADADSMDNCEKNWKDAFVLAIRRAKVNGSLMSFWYHMHNLTSDTFSNLISWSQDYADMNNVRLKFMNIKEINNYLT